VERRDRQGQREGRQTKIERERQIKIERKDRQR
jgi:hypothetical protein